MKLTTKGRYGLRAVLDIALHQHEGPVTIHSIHQRQEISERYLESLLGKLKQSGLIRSIRGFQGGYVLDKDPKEISVGDIITVLEGPIAPVECVNNDGSVNCTRAELCATRKVWSDLKDAMDKVVYSYSLQDLIDESQRITSNRNYDYCI